MKILYTFDRGIKKKTIFLLIIIAILIFSISHGIEKVAKNKEIKNKRLKKNNPYGEFITWEQAKEIFPRYAKATIIDFETGLQFKVQRRAGSNHADVQPLTAEDTAVMKKIYGGKWSWKRRAILVKIGKRKLAASMNGMPHGAGAIYGNDFPGHFCIHFRGSRTHSGNETLDHQMMVWKAAGKLNEKLSSMKPEEIILLLFTALDQGEIGIAKKVIKADSAMEWKSLENYLKKITWVEVGTIKSDFDIKSKKNIRVYEVKIAYGLQNTYKKTEKDLKITVTKNGRWRIAGKSLKIFIEDEN